MCKIPWVIIFVLFRFSTAHAETETALKLLRTSFACPIAPTSFGFYGAVARSSKTKIYAGDETFVKIISIEDVFYDEASQLKTRGEAGTHYSNTFKSTSFALLKDLGEIYAKGSTLFLICKRNKKCLKDRVEKVHFATKDDTWCNENPKECHAPDISRALYWSMNFKLCDASTADNARAALEALLRMKAGK